MPEMVSGGGASFNRLIHSSAVSAIGIGLCGRLAISIDAPLQTLKNPGSPAPSGVTSVAAKPRLQTLYPAE